MIKLEEYLGRTIYNSLYSSKDKYGVELDDFDDLLYCENEDIPVERVEQLKSLIQYEVGYKIVFISLEASFLLCAWGEKEGLNYLKYYLDSYEPLFSSLGCMFPHRLHNYDTVFEKIENSVMQYRARRVDNSSLSKSQALDEVQPLIESVLSFAKKYEYNMLGFIAKAKAKNWLCFKVILEECMITYLEKNEKSRNDYWNTIDLKLLFEVWDTQFLSEVESKYGVIDVPQIARDRL